MNARFRLTCAALGRAAGALGVAAALSMPATSFGYETPKSVSGPELSMLVRTTIVALHHANITANYSVLHDLGDRQFQANFSQAVLADMFRGFREQGVNLERLVTEVRPAPMSSEPLFHAEAILAVPLTLSLDVLQSRLETLADDLMVELVLRSEP